MPFIEDSDWQEYEEDINDFHEDAFQQVIIWKNPVRTLNKSGSEAPLYLDKELRCLIHYNHFRNWPINIQNITGDTDKQSVQVYFNAKHLDNEGVLNSEGLFEFDPILSRFVVDGVWYKPSGDSKTAQTKNKTLLHFVILRRDILETSEDKY